MERLERMTDRKLDRVRGQMRERYATYWTNVSADEGRGAAMQEQDAVKKPTSSDAASSRLVIPDNIPKEPQQCMR